MANCELRRVYLNNGGYESNGTYWGHGQPLYRYHFDNGVDCDTGTLRASTREQAKEKVRKFCLNDWPESHVVFYR
jgi:hypothetical protein